MTMEVLGVGWGRTGTLSLKSALGELGFGPVYHMYEVYQPEHVARWLRGDLSVLDGYCATVDWPGCSYWRELMVAHPDAKVILSTRNAERWFASFDATVAGVIRRAHRSGGNPAPWVVELRRFVIEVVEQPSFGRLDQLTPAEVIAAYRAHQDAVTDACPSDRLLVHDVADGWSPLCKFLEVPEPDLPFPRVNDRAMFDLLHRSGARSQGELAARFQSARSGPPSGGTYSNE